MTKPKTPSIEKTIFSGKRKTAVAKLKIKQGNGKIFFNYLSHTELGLFHKLALSEPLRIYQQVLGEEPKFDFHIKTRGGGRESQIQAARLGIARALLEITGSDVLKKAYVKYDRNMVVQDFRRKEVCKPGDSKARAKRQKSFR
ncbi:MAG: 30S ribosomal protein S9 [Nanoarchaeota archaeon]|nr:30S ribosomal protein S9 [Nanoarchaeota archaeon]MBU1051454.1 30S ribosomal protein S9 [Nanoarchaeota archaeon]MBU1989013.1 30S ribosomal protein S9 [Nanoarchaeota archaeon]